MAYQNENNIYTAYLCIVTHVEWRNWNCIDVVVGGHGSSSYCVERPSVLGTTLVGFVSVFEDKKTRQQYVEYPCIARHFYLSGVVDARNPILPLDDVTYLVCTRHVPNTNA
jgi:hypothetical protein